MPKYRVEDPRTRKKAYLNSSDSGSDDDWDEDIEERSRDGGTVFRNPHNEQLRAQGGKGGGKKGKRKGVGAKKQNEYYYGTSDSDTISSL